MQRNCAMKTKKYERWKMKKRGEGGAEAAVECEETTVLNGKETRDGKDI